MSEAFAKLLEEELQQCPDITELIDCVFTTLNNHQRSRKAFIRKVQSVNDMKLISLSPVPETLGATTAGSCTISPHDENVAAQNNNNLPTAVTVSPIHTHGNAANVQRGSSFTPGRVVNEDGVGQGSPGDSPLPITRTRRQHTSRNHALEEEQFSFEEARLHRWQPMWKENVHPVKNLSTGSSSSFTPAPQRKFRGPGKKKKNPPPNFGNPRYSEIEQSLRRQIYEYDGLRGLQDLWKMLSAFRSVTTEEIYSRPSDSWIRQLQYRIEFCDALKKKGQSWLIRATVERRFYMVQLMAEYRKAKEEKQAGARSDDVQQTFKRDLFPGKDSKDVQSTWDYYFRIGRPLLEAVERYGYGVLLFPLFKATNKSLHHLNRERTGGLLDYIDKCHPGLEKLLRNLSYVLPKLMIWGLPTAGLQIFSVQLEELATFDDESFNRLLSPPGDVAVMDVEPPSFNREILSWSPRFMIENAIISQSDAMNHGPSGRGTRSSRFDEREQFRYGSSVQLPPIKDIYGPMEDNS